MRSLLLSAIVIGFLFPVAMCAQVARDTIFIYNDTYTESNMQLFDKAFVETNKKSDSYKSRLDF